MKKRGNIFKNAFINAFTTFFYIILVVLLISLLDGTVIDGEKETIIAPIFMLMLFVFSAGLTSFLVFGRPIMWYVDGKKKEATSLLVSTLGIFFIITIFVFLLLIWMI